MLWQNAGNPPGRKFQRSFGRDNRRDLAQFHDPRNCTGLQAKIVLNKKSGKIDFMEM